MSIEILQADCKRAVYNLGNLNNEDLDAIMNSDEKIQEILTGLDQVNKVVYSSMFLTVKYAIIFQSYLKEIENEKENLMASNNSMAEFNLSKEPELVEGREKIEEQSEVGELLTKTVEEKNKILSK